METLALLTVRGVSKSFGRVRAIDGVDFTLRAGEVDIKFQML